MGPRSVWFIESFISIEPFLERLVIRIYIYSVSMFHMLSDLLFLSLNMTQQL